MNILAGGSLVVGSGIEPGQGLIQPQGLLSQVIEARCRSREHDQRNEDSRLLLKRPDPRSHLLAMITPTLDRLASGPVDR